jgi:predicted O-methyltransferase YrrM
MIRDTKNINTDSNNFNFRMGSAWRHQFVKIINENQKEGMRVLELGTYDGQSSVRMIPTIEKNNGHYIAIDWFYGTKNPSWETKNSNPHYYDPNQSDDTYARFIHNISVAVNNPNWQEVVTVLRGRSDEVYNQVEDNSLDILIIDGDHRYSAVIKDIELYLPKLKNGGIIAFDDCEMLGVACNGIINHWPKHASDEAAEDDAANGRFGRLHWGVVKAVCEVFGDWPYMNIDGTVFGNAVAWTKIDDELMTNKRYKKFRRL